MRIKAMLVLTVMLEAGAMQATTITDSFSGVISGTATDTYGLFGTAGKSLLGDSFSTTYTYNTADYGPALGCGTNCTYYNSNHTQGSADISVTINHLTQNYTPSLDGQVEFQNSFPGYNANFFSAASDAADGTRGGGLVFSSASPVAFGSTSVPILNSTAFPDSFDFYTAGGVEEIEFNPLAVPEPTTTSMMFLGLLLIAFALRKRLAELVRPKA